MEGGVEGGNATQAGQAVFGLSLDEELGNSQLATGIFVGGTTLDNPRVALKGTGEAEAGLERECVWVCVLR